MKLCQYLSLFVLFVALQIDVTHQLDPQCKTVLGPWFTRSNAPSFHIEGATAVVNNKLYLVGGFASNDLVPSPRVDIYDPVTNKWTQGAPAPFNASHCQGASTTPFLASSPSKYDRYIWVASGFLGKHPGATSKGVWQYDTVDDVWTDLPSLPELRASGGVTIAGSNLHYIGGLRDRDHHVDTHWTYDLDAHPTTWKNSTNMTIGRNHFQAKLVRGVIYTLGGQFHHDKSPVDTRLLHGFDVATETWKRLADLPMNRSHSEPGTILVNDRIVMIGGRNNQQKGQVLNSTIEYNPALDEWTFLRDLPQKRIGIAAGFFKNITINGVLGDYVVVTCGGADYNIGRTETWASQVVYNCTEATSTDSESTQEPISTNEVSDVTEVSETSEASESNNQETSTTTEQTATSSYVSSTSEDTSTESSRITFTLPFDEPSELEKTTDSIPDSGSSTISMAGMTLVFSILMLVL